MSRGSARRGVRRGVVWVVLGLALSCWPVVSGLAASGRGHAVSDVAARHVVAVGARHHRAGRHVAAGLRVTGASVRLQAGDVLAGSAIVRNSGARRARPSTAAVAWSSGKGGGMVQIHRFKVPALAPGHLHKAHFNVAVPKDVSGIYEVSVCADVLSQVEKFSKKHECRKAGTVTVGNPSSGVKGYGPTGREPASPSPPIAVSPAVTTPSTSSPSPVAPVSPGPAPEPVPSPPSPSPSSTLHSGEQLAAGEELLSPDGAYKLIMQGDGNLVLYHEGTALWSSGVEGEGSYVAMQGDGNLVIYNHGSTKWNTNTAGFSGADLQVQDDGNVVIYQGNRPIWDWGSGYLGDRLLMGSKLEPGAYLLSKDHQYELIMQGDGNLVLYHEGTALWSSGIAGEGAFLAMQEDGNLVIYNAGSARWNANTAGFPGADLQLQDDSNAVMYQGGHAIWDWESGYLGDRLLAGMSLEPGAYLLSEDHQYDLIMQGDGNLVLYHDGAALWSTDPQGAGAYVIMQGDGNLVIYNGGAAKWNSGTEGHPGAYLQVQDDSNAVIYEGGTALWDWESGLIGGGVVEGQWPGAAGPISANQQYGYPYPDAPACTDGGACLTDAWDFYQGQCTSWVAYRLNELNGIAFTDYYGGRQWGNAESWGSVASALGIAVNGTPAVGSIAWYASGHVAYVEEVKSSTSVVISEMNYDYDNGFGVRTITTSSGWPTAFIHVHDR
jgi:surface antigen